MIAQESFTYRNNGIASHTSMNHEPSVNITFNKQDNIEN